MARLEKRFHAADKDKNGMLSREEAYAEFPRAPEFFDEIDVNKDGQITLVEVKKAMQKRVDAALKASNDHGKYRLPESAAPTATASTPTTNSFSSKGEASRYYRHEYYESLAGTKDAASNRGEPTQPLMRKEF